MSDLNFQDLSTVQNLAQQKPVTLVAADTITPVTFMTLLTGVTTINTINPPVTGSHMLVFISAAATVIGTSGNIAGAGFTMAADIPAFFFYNPSTGEYTGGELVAT